jgi:hypothetical protein
MGAQKSGPKLAENAGLPCSKTTNLYICPTKKMEPISIPMTIAIGRRIFANDKPSIKTQLLS